VQAEDLAPNRLPAPDPLDVTYHHIGVLDTTGTAVEERGLETLCVSAIDSARPDALPPKLKSQLRRRPRAQGPCRALAGDRMAVHGEQQQ